MNKVCFINGSPRKKSSFSSYIISEIIKLIKPEISSKEFFISSIMKDNSQFEEIIKYNKIVFVSPLYVDSLPSTMLEFMIQFEIFLKNKNIQNIDVYSVINCGFLEGSQNHIAVEIMENYCNRLNLNWRFGIGIGGGEFMRASKSIPLNSFIKKRIYNSLLELKIDLENNFSDDKVNILTNPKIFKWLFILTANKFWISSGKNNGLNKKELFYRDSVN